MAMSLSRRNLLKTSGLALGAGIVSPLSAFSEEAPATSASSTESLIRLSFNENPYGPSPRVAEAIQREFTRLNRYADASAAQQLVEKIAAYEQLPVQQVVLGEILGLLGIYLASEGGPGSEFLYSTPGYLALIDAAARLGGVGIPVPLDAHYQNDLAALRARITAKTRAIYLVNPHNPTGTVNENQAFKHFLRESSQHAVAIVDEAYLEYTDDFAERSAVALVREGASVIVFRTFDKIHGLAGLPIGYVLAPKSIADALRKQGAGDAESLGRFNIAAASAALGDTAQVARTREAVARERAIWLRVLRDLNLPHTDTYTNFIFFDAGQPQPKLAEALRACGVEIGRPHTPFTNWARITIGLPEENLRAQAALRKVLQLGSIRAIDQER
jgi:histidinol-phosphate aminotransferase